ncbi:hypothetical protein BO79DRAFT_64581 [Aspergillus costaricaensis CBS 115574]|uniref:Uncharacterized protein n=1 Tax=Aspergillus costaricaensis CBS 115574 TaxID=1448317 RepID=A0ACD1IP81_9EURO|nr:hypothetical protein BO79DRAFT_64581 [Aspergillus costaricaensis CBS 115574]RAK92384.1 hypothetical protein BO79DRAFT_64581 [Aspergillus costaricaensis CBS 115574]
MIDFSFLSYCHYFLLPPHLLFFGLLYICSFLGESFLKGKTALDTFLSLHVWRRSAKYTSGLKV